MAKAKAEREKYHAKKQELYDIIKEGRANGETTEQIARKVSHRRNELRLESYKDDPAGLELVKQSNLETYGNEFGPTPEWLYKKYGSWQTVIEKACSSNAGMDACLGLYDVMYFSYGLDEPEEQPTTTQPTTTQPTTQTTTEAPSSEQRTPPTGESGIVLTVSTVTALALCTALASKRKNEK